VNNIGENRAQEAVEKFQQMGTEVNGKKILWHFVGHLQTNKVRQLIGFIDLIHSLDSLSLADEVDKRAGRIGKIQRVLVQVNVAKEQGKFGLDVDKVPEFLKKISKLDHLSVEGLMTMPPLFENPEEARPIFTWLKRLFDQTKEEFTDMPIKYLSMGMTNDFEVAIEEGSNMVRIGRAIFQEREEPV
jgi:pyridoxal phosphate enzyme (YggS family)